GLAAHAPAAEVRAQVRTMGVERLGDAALGAKEDQLAGKRAHRMDPTSRQLARVGEHEPAAREPREGEAVGHPRIVARRSVAVQTTVEAVSLVAGPGREVELAVGAEDERPQPFDHQRRVIVTDERGDELAAMMLEL